MIFPFLSLSPQSPPEMTSMINLKRSRGFNTLSQWSQTCGALKTLMPNFIPWKLWPNCLGVWSGLWTF